MAMRTIGPTPTVRELVRHAWRRGIGIRATGFAAGPMKVQHQSGLRFERIAQRGDTDAMIAAGRGERSRDR